MMMYRRAGFERGEARRFGAIVAVVLSLHGVAVLCLCQRGAEPRLVAMPRRIPTTIRLVTAIQAPHSGATATRSAPPLPQAPVASRNETHDREIPHRVRAPIKTNGGPLMSRPVSPLVSPNVGRPNDDVARISKQASTAAAHEEMISPTPSASSAPQEHEASAPAESDAETEPIFNAAYLHNPAPDYPPAALQRGLAGTVWLNVHVLANGSAQQVTVIASSGHASLDDAAVQAVAAWRFTPARRAGQAIDGWVRVPLVFKPG